MEYYPAAVGGHVVIDFALEFLALEDGLGVFSEVKEMLGQAGAPGVGDGVDSHFNFVDVVEERVEKSPVEVLAPYLFPHDIYLIRITASTLSFLLPLLGGRLLLHPNDLLLLLDLLGGQKLSPLFVQLSLLCFYVQLNCLPSQLLSLLIKQQHSRNILLSSHPFPFNEFHVSLVVVVLLIFQK